MTEHHDWFHTATSAVSHFIESPTVKGVFDTVSVGAIFGNFVGWLTLNHIALGLSAIWTFGRLVEMFTGKPIHKLVAELRGKSNGT